MKKTIKVLVVFANPRGTDALRLGTEDRVIHESIKLSKNRDNFQLTVCHATTIHDLRRALLNEEFQIVHISGHGTGVGLVLENEIGGRQVVPQHALAELFSAYCPPIECVLLNACYSITQGQLLSLGIPYTIAMEGPISDDAAIEFSRGFYDAIGAGKDMEFSYQEGCRNVKLSTSGSKFLSKILKNGEIQSGEPITYSEGASSVSPTRTFAESHTEEKPALVGLAVDLSGSMATSIRNDSGGQVSRLDSFRQSLEKLVKEAKNRVRDINSKNLQTSIDVFAYGFGLRAMNVCDLLSLIKVGQNVITKEEIEELRQRYIREMQSNYSGYSGLGDLAKQFGFGGLVRQAETTLRANAEAEIRRKIMLEVKHRLESQLQNIGDTTLSIDDLAKIWESSGEILSNAEELIFGSTPMRECMIEVSKRFEREIRSRKNNVNPVLFILSDGEPTDGDPLPALELLKTLGVSIISCYITDQDIANPRILYGKHQEIWGNGAKLMFDMASTADENSPFVKFLLQKNWIINPKARLFVQVNHSLVLEEFIRVVISPFEFSASSDNLPIGI